MRRFPHSFKLPSDHECVFEKDGGILLATKAVALIQVCCKLSTEDE